MILKRALSLAAAAILCGSTTLLAQRQPGRSIGKVTTIGNLIHIEVADGALVPEHLFDLDHRTLRFTPEGSGYRIENLPLRWDADFGPAVEGGAVALMNFRFPFSGRTWDAFLVGIGSISFVAEGAAPAVTATAAPPGAAGARPRGFAMERYASMQTVGSTFINRDVGIAALVRVGFNGERYAKALADRAVVTWTLSEGAGGIQAFSWAPTVNRIQAVLHRDGIIELSYNGVNAKDGVVGVFPLVDGGAKQALAVLADGDDAAAPAHLDIRAVKLAVIDDLFLEATFETRGPVPAAGDSALNGISYRLALGAGTPAVTDPAQATVLWTITGRSGRGGGGGGGGGAAAGYTASGPGTFPVVTVAGNAISVKGVLPKALANVASVTVFAAASAAPPAPGTPGTMVDDVAPTVVPLRGMRSPELDLSGSSGNAASVLAYEGFHWSSIPRATDVACTVIQALGDRFDFIASYSDFRVDNPEGGTPSTGPRGGNVSGIGSQTRDLGAFCSQGQLQFMYAQPVSTAAVQSGERSTDGRMTDYNYAMSQIGHELGHRWGADAFALVKGERINLGPTHWVAGLNLPSAFPYSRPVEADAMGGSVWQDLGNGRWAQLDRDYYSPAKGFSWFALYLMGLARPEEVPPQDFFLLRNLQRTGEADAAGHPIFRGERLDLSISDVIAAMGPRVPSFENAQKDFRTGIVIMTLPGEQPTPELLKSARDIAERWVKYWSQVTGGRSTMSTGPQ